VFPDLVPLLQDLRPVRNIHRRLLPRRPTRDSGLEQHFTLYAPSQLSDLEAFHPTVLVLTPILPSDGLLPYYHPTVTHLAFRIIPLTSSESVMLRIEALPLHGTPLDPGARLYRTASRYSRRCTATDGGHSHTTRSESCTTSSCPARPIRTYISSCANDTSTSLMTGTKSQTHSNTSSRSATHALLPPCTFCLNAARTGHRHSDVPHAPLERYI
jgi:hypothetical protein